MVEGAALTLTHSELVVCFVFGVIGGFVLDLFTYRGGIEFPRKRSEKETAPGIVSGKLVTFLDLGFIADMIIGGVAAIVVLRFVSPTDSIQLLTTSVTWAISLQNRSGSLAACWIYLRLLKSDTSTSSQTSTHLISSQFGWFLIFQPPHSLITHSALETSPNGIESAADKITDLSTRNRDWS